MILSFKEHPLTVATVTQPEDIVYLEGSGIVTAEVLEFRLDVLVKSVDSATKVMRTVENSSLLTVRSPEEQGANSLTTEDRLTLYGENLSSVELVDTEIASLKLEAFQGFPAQVHERGAKLIGSLHEFDSFPGIHSLRSRVDEAFDLGADIAKIAVHISEMSQLFDLVTLVESHHREGRLVSAMGMGPLGKVSRLVLAAAGSCLNYGYLHIPNAPGQWPAEELKRLIAAMSS
ncbi:MAG: type I 3-dehydroquinate dehydratase [Verrucomicrobiota bacterium]